MDHRVEDSVMPDPDKKTLTRLHAKDPDQSYHKVDVASDIVELLQDLHRRVIPDDAPYELLVKIRKRLQKMVDKFPEA